MLQKNRNLDEVDEGSIFIVGIGVKELWKVGREDARRREVVHATT